MLLARGYYFTEKHHSDADMQTVVPVDDLLIGEVVDDT
jgi:hypothetical protein